MGIKTKPTSHRPQVWFFTRASSFLCFCFISALNNLWLPDPCSALISLSAVLMSFPGCECIPVVEQPAAGAQHGACPHPSIRGKHKWLHRQPQPAANTQTLPGQEFCFAKDLTEYYFSPLSSCTHHGFRKGEIPQRCVCLSI